MRFFASAPAPCYLDRMDALAPWLTLALLIALFTWLRRDMGELRRDFREQRRELSGRIDTLAKDVNTFAKDVLQRFDDVKRELAELRERMAKLEGSLEGFLAGRRDRDAA